MEPILYALKRHIKHIFNGERVPDLILDTNLYKSKFVKFIKSEFLGNLKFNEVNLSHGINFLDCNFSGSILFRNIIVDSYDPLLNPDSESIKFQNCIFEDRVCLIGKNEFERSVVFYNCTFKKGLEFDSCNIFNGSLIINDCSFNEKFDIFRSDFKQGITLSNNSIETYLRIVGINGSSISFVSNNVISGNLHINNCQLENGIIFNDGTFKDGVKFSLIQTINIGLTIIGSTFEKSFIVNYHDGKNKPKRGISKYFISESKFLNGIYINGNNEPASELSPLVEEINIKASAKLTGEIVFRDLDVGKINISGFNSSANIIFRGIFVNEFGIISFTNNSGLIFSFLNGSSEDWLDNVDNLTTLPNTFYIEDSDLGKAQFYNVDFNSFDKVIINSAILSDISTSLITWFKDDLLNETALNDAKRLFINAKKRKRLVEGRKRHLLLRLNSNREIFRQLKYVAQKQGDIPQSLTFQRIEMRYYRQINKLEKSWWRSESLILWSNHFSNDFGQSWLKAFVLLQYDLIEFLNMNFEPCEFENFQYSFLELEKVHFFELKLVLYYMGHLLQLKYQVINLRMHGLLLIYLSHDHQ
ncbi:MAG: hypothetical protein MUF43_12225 [Flavobacterium sp.]|nr:hypothetical protein [Flavobacterium sp.]